MRGSFTEKLFSNAIFVVIPQEEENLFTIHSANFSLLAQLSGWCEKSGNILNILSIV